MKGGFKGMRIKQISLMKDKRGLSLNDAIPAVLVVGFVFLIMATIAFVSNEYGDAIRGTTACEDLTACNVTTDLQTEISDNTSIAGIVLTIILVGIILGVLIGVFASTRGSRI